MGFELAASEEKSKSTFLSVGSVVANSLFMVVALVFFCIVLASLRSIRIGPRGKKPAFGVSDKVRFKSAFSATEIS